MSLYFAKALIHGFTRVTKPSFYQNSKAEFSQIYDLYFAKALIHGFTRVMKPGFY